MKVKDLLAVLFNIEYVKICKDDESAYWGGYAYATPEKFYNYKIDKVCSFTYDYSNSCIYIFIK